MGGAECEKQMGSGNVRDKNSADLGRYGTEQRRKRSVCCVKDTCQTWKRKNTTKPAGLWMCRERRKEGDGNSQGNE